MLLQKKCNFFSLFVFAKSQEWHFSKGVSPCFWSKYIFFFFTCFRSKSTRNGVEWCFRQKTNFFWLLKKIFQRLKTGIFPKRVNPRFWSKNAIFFHYLFSLKIRLELRVNNVRDIKKTFFDYKKLFHSLKNCLFAKGLTHVFG